MAARRSARTVWKGTLLEGSGVVTAESSGVFRELPVSWAARTEDRSGGLTSPEELLAAAHASCFCMSLSSGLAKQGTPAESLDVTATATFDKVGEGWKVVSMELALRGEVPGIDEEAFAEAAATAKDGCPISGALKGNVDIRVTAELVRS
jgi:osmotically inducible protein OsmC